MKLALLNSLNILKRLISWYMSLNKDQKIVVFIGLFTIASVYFYRQDLTLKYSPVISTRIITLRDVNDPQIAIFNFSDQSTIITDYKIKFRSEGPKKEHIDIKAKYLEKNLTGETLPPKAETIFYFKNENGDHPVLTFLENKGKEIKVFCEGSITVKNRMKFRRNKKFDFKCARGSDYRDPKTLFWYVYPGPSYIH